MDVVLLFYMMCSVSASGDRVFFWGCGECEQIVFGLSVVCTVLCFGRWWVCNCVFGLWGLSDKVFTVVVFCEHFVVWCLDEAVCDCFVFGHEGCCWVVKEDGLVGGDFEPGSC